MILRFGERLLIWFARDPESAEGLIGDLREDDERSGRARWQRVLIVYALVARYALHRVRQPGRAARVSSRGPRAGDRWGKHAVDLRYSARRFFRYPIATLTIVITIAVGIGATTSIYSVVRGVLLAPPSFGDPEGVVLLWMDTKNLRRVPFTAADFRDLRALSSFSDVAGSWGTVGMALGAGQPVAVQAVHMSTNYLETLRILPTFGGPGIPDPQGRVEMGTGLGGDVVISHRLFESMFGSDSGVVGDHVPAGVGTVRIAGVLPEGVNLNVSGFSNIDPLTGVDVWIPLGDSYFAGNNRSLNWVNAVARLAPGTSLAEAQTELDVLAASLRNLSASRADAELAMRVVPVVQDVVRDVRGMLYMLMAAVVFVWLIACSNVTNILLADLHARRREMAIRAALGEGRVGAVAQVLVGSVLIALVGGALGVGLAYMGAETIKAWAPATLPRTDQIRMDRGVLLFGLVATMSATVMASVLPALKAGREDYVTEHLHRRSGVGVTGHWLRRLLVSGQIALSLVLVAGGALFLRSLTELHAARPGFQSERLLTFLFNDSRRFGSAQAMADGVREVATRLEAVPGVVAAGFTQRMPLRGGVWSATSATEEMVAVNTVGPNTAYRFVSPGYLPALGTRLLAGRLFHAADPEDVVIIDATLARELWPGDDPLGKRVRTTTASAADPTGRWSRVIGVVEHVRHETVAKDALPTVYYPIFSVPMGPRLYGAVRTVGDPLTVFDDVRSALHEIVPRAVIAQPYTMDELVSRDLSATRFSAGLLGAFGVAAVLLAAVGLYGVLAQWVEERRFEIAVRRALGAQRRSVVTVIGREVVGMLLVGAVVGIGAAVGLHRLIEAMVFGVTPGEPLVLAGTAVVLTASVVTGAAIPVRRALRVSPITVLR